MKSKAFKLQTYQSTKQALSTKKKKKLNKHTDNNNKKKNHEASQG
jgi:hypothetical protein